MVDPRSEWAVMMTTGACPESAFSSGMRSMPLASGRRMSQRMRTGSRSVRMRRASAAEPAVSTWKAGRSSLSASSWAWRRSRRLGLSSMMRRLSFIPRTRATPVRPGAAGRFRVPGGRCEGTPVRRCSGFPDSVGGSARRSRRWWPRCAGRGRWPFARNRWGDRPWHRAFGPVPACLPLSAVGFSNSLSRGGCILASERTPPPSVGKKGKGPPGRRAFSSETGRLPSLLGLGGEVLQVPALAQSIVHGLDAGAGARLSGERLGGGGEEVADVVPEGGDDADGGNGDEGDDDHVLGHPLAVLPTEGALLPAENELSHGRSPFARPSSQPPDGRAIGRSTDLDFR